jgi:hypothetical protein
MGRVEKINKQKLEGVPRYYYIYFLGVDPPRQGSNNPDITTPTMYVRFDANSTLRSEIGIENA